MSDLTHVPVLAERVTEILAVALAEPGAVAVDATVGLGGHAAALLRRCATARLVGLDRDTAALSRATERLARYADRVTLVHASYAELPAVLARLGLRVVRAVLFDLGVSSLQLDDLTRGFAYRVDAPLDMRMDRTAGGPTAADVVNTYPAGELAAALRRGGEEHARRIAAAVVAARTTRSITTSEQLVEVVRAALPAGARRSGHPAKRTFQALRIEVNGELAALAQALPAAVDALAGGGRIAVLAYHSLEDRLVKRTFAAAARPAVPVDLPVVPAGYGPRLRLLTRGAERPPAGEVAANPRAAAARLRAAERVAAAA